MRLYPGIDYTQRPTSYWDDPDPLTAILRNVQGVQRRAMIRNFWEAGRFEELDEQLAREVLPEGTRDRLGRIHPAFMGGEYLPPYLPGEREIARIELQSTTSDVVSIRARPSGQGIRYRVVDEYKAEFTLARQTSAEPLTLRQLIAFIDGSGHPELPGSLALGYNEMNAEAHESREELQFFTRIRSDLYPQLERHYEGEFEAWAKAGPEAEDQ